MASVEQRVFLTGMFRSGTTLLGRMVNAHPNMAIASDGLFPLFKYFRNEVWEGVAGHRERRFERPLHDYYFDSDARALFDTIQASCMSERISEEEIVELREVIAKWCVADDQYAPLLAPRVNGLTGSCYREVFDSALDIVFDAYGGNDTKVLGIKEVWTGEFLPAMGRAMPDMKFIYLVRDPRSVVASKKNRQAKYPLLFMARQWRKLAALGWHYATNDEFLRERTLLLTFEELIGEPERVTRRICRFLGVPWDETMISPAEFVDGRGAPWSQNSAFQVDRSGSFDTQTLSRWKSSLGEREIAAIEYLCGPEMALFGYRAESSLGSSAREALLFDPPRMEPDELAKWIRPYACGGYADLVAEFHREEIRRRLLGSPGVASGPWREELVNGAFLLEAVPRYAMEHPDFFAKGYLHD